MKTILYLDLIILLDSIFNFIFIYLIERIYNEKTNYFLISGVSLLGGLMIILAIYSQLFLNIFKIIGGLILIILSTIKNEKSKIIIKISLFYTLNFSLVGLLSAFKVNNWYSLVGGLIVILVLIIFENYRKYHIFIKRSEYNVIIKSDKNIINLKGFLDTGNMSTYLGYPIVYINKKHNISTKYLKKYFISLETINGVDYHEGFLYKDLILIINNKKHYRDVIIVFTDIEVDCLLNPMLLL